MLTALTAYLLFVIVIGAMMFFSGLFWKLGVSSENYIPALGHCVLAVIFASIGFEFFGGVLNYGFRWPFLTVTFLVFVVLFWCFGFGIWVSTKYIDYRETKF